MPDRDYVTEMNAAIETAIPDGDYVAAILAADIIDHLVETDRDLLTGWLMLKARVFLTDYIGTRRRSDRAHHRAHAPRKAFAEAAESFKRGDGEALHPFRLRYEIDDKHTLRTVSDMTGADHRFVAASYDRDARVASMLKAFHTAVARKVGKKKTSEVYSEDEYLRLYRSITGESAA